MTDTCKLPSCIQPYLFFDGKCEEALNFYTKAIGAKVDVLMRFKDAPEGNAACPDGTKPPGDKVMHANFRVADTVLMASDGNCEGKSKFQGFSLSLSVQTEDEAKSKFAALAEGGQIIMPLNKTFFSPSFGMVTDKFGLCWMVIIPMPMPGA